MQPCWISGIVYHFHVQFILKRNLEIPCFNEFKGCGLTRYYCKSFQDQISTTIDRFDKEARYWEGGCM